MEASRKEWVGGKSVFGSSGEFSRRAKGADVVLQVATMRAGGEGCGGRSCRRLADWRTLRIAGIRQVQSKVIRAGKQRGLPGGTGPAVRRLDWVKCGASSVESLVPFPYSSSNGKCPMEQWMRAKRAHLGVVVEASCCVITW